VLLRVIEYLEIDVDFITLIMTGVLWHHLFDILNQGQLKLNFYIISFQHGLLNNILCSIYSAASETWADMESLEASSLVFIDPWFQCCIVFLFFIDVILIADDHNEI
jgi:hypothetical protein